MARGGVLVAMLVVLLHSHAAAAERRLAFYDPDANHQALLGISAAFNDYLKRVDSTLVFQPIQSREAFEQLLKEGGADFAIVSSEYLKQAPSESLQPMLVPSANGDTYYRKLVVDRGVGEPGALDG